MLKSLKTMMKEVREVNTEKGWLMESDLFMIRDSVNQELMSMTVYLADICEAYRNNDIKQFQLLLNFIDNKIQVSKFNLQKGFMLDIQAKNTIENLFLIVTEIAEAYKAVINRDKKNFAEECADILIRLLDICENADIDLEAEYEKKMIKNRKRAYRHGNKRV